ncbi:MAG TPA: plastocyanin/azurin family copper-binding protein [Nitrososphaera sp.]|nr:plastocyanin/azurin family copper-binding protein [Nitrososphaera sp.]
MNSRIAVAVGLVAAIAVVLVPISTLTPAFAAEVQAEIRAGSSSLTDDAYSPNPIEINVGDTVTWTNRDSTPHTVTSGVNGVPDGKFDSSPNFNPLIAPQQKFSHTFAEAGEFPYYCGLHPNMVGTVIVRAAAGGDGGPEPAPERFTITATGPDGVEYEITGSGSATATAATINPGESVEIEFDGAGDVELTLPKEMVSGITAVMIGTEQVQPEVVNENDTHTTISFTIPEGQTSATILAEVVVPEFPVIAAILAATIAAVIGYTRFARSGTGFFGRA